MASASDARQQPTKVTLATCYYLIDRLSDREGAIRWPDSTCVMMGAYSALSAKSWPTNIVNGFYQKAEEPTLVKGGSWQ